MVHHSKARIATLREFIGEFADPTITLGHEVSDVKADGTVFVRFRSTTESAARHSADALAEAFDDHLVVYERIEDFKFRLKIDQFSENRD